LEIVHPERIGEANANLVASNGHVERLTDSCVEEDVGGAVLVAFSLAREEHDIGVFWNIQTVAAGGS
jgi:hypothetical protein